MKNSTFKIQASFCFVKRVDFPFWGLFSRSYALDLPVLDEEVCKQEAAYRFDLGARVTFVKVDVDFLSTSKGGEFLTRYLDELKRMLKRLKPRYREILLSTKKYHFFDYSLDVLIENKSSHATPATLDAFELSGRRQLLHTVSRLKQPLAAGETLVLNDIDDEDFMEYVCFTDYWALKGDEMVFHYDTAYLNDYDGSEEIEYQATIDSTSFISRFSHVSYGIIDVLEKVASAMDVDPASIEPMEYDPLESGSSLDAGAGQFGAGSASQ